MTPPSGSGRQLTAEDWIEAGFTLLADGGPDALKIGRLCEKLDVTKGSFYWHFTDIGEYRSALAAAWGSLHDERRRRCEAFGHAEPRTRLEVLMQTLVRPDYWALERAMRAWAMTDDGALASVQRSDQRVLCAVRQALRDYGFDDDEADLRSEVLFAAGVGLLYRSTSAKDVPVVIREHVVDFILRP
ncbi:TetR/AcrR family transcriptional regulator [Mycolicibacterium sp. XJ1819]